MFSSVLGLQRDTSPALCSVPNNNTNDNNNQPSTTNSIKDAKGRRPDDAEYDPRTLHVPTQWFRDAKVTEAQQQWWRFKAANFDSVLLFKVGKFYEVRGDLKWSDLIGVI